MLYGGAFIILSNSSSCQLQHNNYILFFIRITTLCDSIHVSDNKRASVEIFLKASGFLECAIQHVLPRISPENRWVELPSHLQKAYHSVVSAGVIDCHFV